MVPQEQAGTQPAPTPGRAIEAIGAAVRQGDAAVGYGTYYTNRNEGLPSAERPRPPAGPVTRTVPKLALLIAAHHATGGALARPGDRVVVTRSPAELAVVFLERPSGPVLADRGHPDDVPGADLDRPAAGVLHSAELGRGVAGLDRVELHLRHGPRVLDREHRDGRLARAVDDSRVLRGRPRRLVVGPERAERARDVDDDRVLRLLQQRQRRLGDPDDANGIRVEHLQRFRPVERDHPDAGVVDQDVEPAVGLDLSEGGGD